MDENLLLSIAIACSIIGVIGLYLIAGRIEADESAISRINSGQADSEVMVSGKVSRITDEEGFVIIEIERKERIPVFVMKNNDYSGLRKDDMVQVRGAVQEYKGKKEIVADEIRIV